MKFFHLICLMAGFALMGCNDGNVDLDNFGDQTLEVKIDELAYKMPPKSYKRIDLAPGSIHTIVVTDESGEVIKDQNFKVDKGGLLNVGGSRYVIWTELYGDESLREKHLKEVPLEVDNMIYHGDFEEVDPELIYLESRWDLGLDESFPTQVMDLQFQKEKWMTKRKLYRVADLVEEYQSQIQSN
ncbi:hypothetical protein [Pontibacter sp. G13]|uniref:hypothetical protein n=1 Tax=Pontibacter sp. G13 TaxID=3074898 RepID=UPI00288C3659|nr:hypothetical protein [Pontibacter sp. G13]WNJ18489.1 hypothetical protein RJD25_26840 [Pontibacter sp. G13]